MSRSLFLNVLPFQVSPKLSLFVRFPHQNWEYISLLSHARHMSHPSYPTLFGLPNNIWRELLMLTLFLLSCLCILIIMYPLFCRFCFHRANWHSPATVTEVFPCFFLSFKANVRVYLAKMGHGPHSS